MTHPARILHSPRDSTLKPNVIPRVVSEYKLSSLCEQDRGTLCFLRFNPRSLAPTRALKKARPHNDGARDDESGKKLQARTYENRSSLAANPASPRLSSAFSSTDKMVLPAARSPFLPASLFFSPLRR